jgi:nitrite reductase/ring-hydroxylating ferredoxin subunit
MLSDNQYRYIGHPIYASSEDIMGSQEVAKLDEITVGKMKSVTAFSKSILLSNVNGKIYATSNRCGHSNAPLQKGTLEGNVVTCPLHAAQFDVITGKNLRSPQLSMPPEMMQKIPSEIIAMFKKSSEIIAEISVENIKTHKVNIQGNSVFVEDL